MRPTSSTRSSLMEISLVARHEGTVTRNTPRLRLAHAETPAVPECRALRPAGLRGPVCAPATRAADRWARRGNLLARVRHAAHDADARRDFLQQLDGARDSANRIGRVLRFLEAHGRVGAQLDRGGSLANRCRLETSRSPAPRAWYSRPMALSQPPITPASAMAPPASAITRLDGVERVVFAIQRAEPLAGMRAADEDGVALQQVGIEGVHGLRQLGHHEVRHVDDVVDGVEADRASAAACSHSGDGCTVTFSKTSALYRGHRSRSSTCTWIAGGPVGQQAELRRIFQRAAQMAATSRAMP